MQSGETERKAEKQSAQRGNRAHSGEGELRENRAGNESTVWFPMIKNERRVSIYRAISLLSSKTTEVYTHITTKGVEQIENPMDHLDI